MLDPLHSFSTIAHIAVTIGLFGLYVNGKKSPPALNRLLLWLLPIFAINSISLLLWSFSQTIAHGILSAQEVDENMRLVASISAAMSYVVAILWTCLILEIAEMQEFPGIKGRHLSKYVLYYIGGPVIIVMIIVFQHGGALYLVNNLLAMVFLTRPLFMTRDDGDEVRRKADVWCSLLLLYSIIASDVELYLLNPNLWIVDRIRSAIALNTLFIVAIAALRKQGQERMILLVSAFAMLILIPAESVDKYHVFGWGILRPLLILVLIIGAIPKESREGMGKWIGLHELILIALISSPLLEMMEHLFPIDPLVAATIIAVLVAIVASNNNGRFSEYLSRYEFDKGFLSTAEAQANPSKPMIALFTFIITLIACAAALINHLYLLV
jgi:hypothetical protein